MGYMIQKFLFYRRGQYTLTQCFVGLSQTEKQNVGTAFGKQFDERKLRGRQTTMVMTVKDSCSWTQQKKH
jgi:long-subunit fatty acid transport protein